MITQKPSFCYIAPTQYLEQYATQSKTHLVLAHIVDADETYATFYKTQSSQGDFIIMDNGAFERGIPYQPDRLIELAHKCGAHAIVLPDYPFQESKVTIEAARQLIDKVKSAGFKTMYVPQSKTGEFEDWVNGYLWGAINDDIDIIGMSILGIPNALKGSISPILARVVATQILIERTIFNFDKHHHYLGLTAAPTIELPSLLSMNALTTCDSSGPIWYGINGLRYNTDMDGLVPISKKYVREVNFDEELSKRPHIHEIIQHNINVTNDIFNNPLKYLS
jgi:hypothetical protein